VSAPPSIAAAGGERLDEAVAPRFRAFVARFLHR